MVSERKIKHLEILRAIINEHGGKIPKKELVKKALERYNGERSRRIYLSLIRRELVVHRGFVYTKESFLRLNGKATTLTSFFARAEQIKQAKAEEAEEGRGIRHIDVDYSKFMVENVEEYIPQGDEYEDVKKILLSGKPVLLTGIKGIGKSLLAANIAKELGIPRFVFNCSQSVCEDDIIGNFVDLGLFADGVVTQAVRAANELGMAMLVLEEVNAMQAGVAMALHSLLDFNKSLVVKPTGEVYKVNGHGKLLIVATANIGYQGTLPMNEAFKSRFVPVHLPNPKPEMMAKVARKHVANEEVVNAFVSIVKGLQEAAKRGEISDFPSIRELVTACHLYNTFRESPGDALDKKAFEKAVKYAFVMPYASNPSEADLVKSIILSSCPVRVGLEW